jgi:hypothetical protein
MSAELGCQDSSSSEPHLAEQRNIIKLLQGELAEHGPVAGQVYCVLSQDWWKAFTLYVNYDKEDSPALARHPGRIDNSFLTESIDGQLLLKKIFVETFDYVFVPEMAWKHLHNWCVPRVHM